MSELNGKTDLSQVLVLGSAEEVRALGLDTRTIHTCQPKDPVQGIRGCPIFFECDRPEKGLGGFVTWTKDGEKVTAGTDGAQREGPGPLNLGVQEITKRGNAVKVVNSVCQCWMLPHRKTNHESGNAVRKNSRLLKVIGREGESIFLPGSVATTVEGKIVHEFVMEGIETKIKPIPRPASNPALARNAFAAAELRRVEERANNADIRDFIRVGGGSEGDSPPTPTKPEPGAGKRGAASRG